MANWKIANSFTKANEGGLANSSVDRGRLTYRGIASAFWPNWPGWATVRKVLADCNGDVDAADKILGKNAVLQAQVDDFFIKNFWNVYNLDQVSDQLIANKIYDAGVNLGVPVESKFIQRSLNMTNRNQKLYPDLLVDGIIGTVTIGALNNHPKPKLVLKILNVLQGGRYIDIMEHDHTQEVFAESWFSRVEI